MTASYDRDAALVQAAVDAVDLTRFATAVRNTLGKFDVESTNFRSFGLPKYTVSKAKQRSWRPPYNIICGSAHMIEHSCTVYAPGLARRRSCGFGLNLSTLEVMCHETAHRLSGHRLTQGAYSDSRVSYEGGRHISGYSQIIALDGIYTSASNEMLNEGVTQFFALELMHEYLRLGRYMDVSKPAVARHFESIEGGGLGTFYPEALSFVEAILMRLSKVLGSQEEACKMFLGGYFRAEPILSHEKWTTLLEECGLLQIMRSARTAEHHQLRPLTTRIRAGRTDRGVWDSVRVEISREEF